MTTYKYLKCTRKNIIALSKANYQVCFDDVNYPNEPFNESAHILFHEAEQRKTFPTTLYFQLNIKDKTTHGKVSSNLINGQILKAL